MESIPGPLKVYKFVSVDRDKLECAQVRKLPACLPIPASVLLSTNVRGRMVREGRAAGLPLIRGEAQQSATRCRGGGWCGSTGLPLIPGEAQQSATRCRGGGWCGSTGHPLICGEAQQSATRCCSGGWCGSTGHPLICGEAQQSATRCCSGGWCGSAEVLLICGKRSNRRQGAAVRSNWRQDAAVEDGAGGRGSR